LKNISSFQFGRNLYPLRIVMACTHLVIVNF